MLIIKHLHTDYYRTHTGDQGVHNRPVSHLITITSEAALFYRLKMRNGYKYMARINKEWASLCVAADTENLLTYEEKLSECE